VRCPKDHAIPSRGANVAAGHARRLFAIWDRPSGRQDRPSSGASLQVFGAKAPVHQSGTKSLAQSSYALGSEQMGATAQSRVWRSRAANRARGIACAT
jgi:hypothetical protein